MTNHLIIITIAHELGLKANQIARTVQLLDEDNTIPFIARYRKEITSGLDEEQLRAIQSRLNYLRNLEERKETVLKSIAEQGK
ncbi:MAG: RNA-binding transcriptional accessory protein, partial [Anaerolineae bacterium]|nr:RNA-binding transcriptional accessory protein [Anaerolineae bacterium]